MTIPGQQFAGHGGDLGPRSGSGRSPAGEVPQAGVLGAPDAVLAPGPAAVAHLQAGDLPPGLGAGGKAGDAVAVDVGET